MGGKEGKRRDVGRGGMGGLRIRSCGLLDAAKKEPESVCGCASFTSSNNITTTEHL